jgi:hypothetical protein
MNDPATLPRRNLESFVRMAYRDQKDGRELGDEPYIAYGLSPATRSCKRGLRWGMNSFCSSNSAHRPMSARRASSSTRRPKTVRPLPF